MKHYLLGILTALIIFGIVRCWHSSSEADDTAAAVVAAMPNQTESDHRKRTALADACRSIADLIESGTLTGTDEVLDCFVIETANLRTNEQWKTIQSRIEKLLRKVKRIDEIEKTLRQFIASP
jgi:hypothetical protein